MSTNNIQTPQQQSRITNFFTVGNSILVPCTTSSGSTRVAFPTVSNGSFATDIMVSNAGSVDVWVALGNSTVTAAIPTTGSPANGIRLPAGPVMTLSKGSATHIAGLTSSSTANLYVSQGYGS